VYSHAKPGTVEVCPPVALRRHRQWRARELQARSCGWSRPSPLSTSAPRMASSPAPRCVLGAAASLGRGSTHDGRPDLAAGRRRQRPRPHRARL